MISGSGQGTGALLVFHFLTLRGTLFSGPLCFGYKKHYESSPNAKLGINIRGY